MWRSPQALRRFSSRKTASSPHAGSNWISLPPLGGGLPAAIPAPLGPASGLPTGGGTIGISWLQRTGRASHFIPFLGEPQRQIARAGGNPQARAVLHQPCQGRLGDRSQDVLFSRP